MDITDRQISAFARKLVDDLRRCYPPLLEQEVRVEAASGVGLDTEEAQTALREARIRVVEEIETSLRMWLSANDVPVAEADLGTEGVSPVSRASEPEEPEA